MVLSKGFMFKKIVHFCGQKIIWFYFLSPGFLFYSLRPEGGAVFPPRYLESPAEGLNQRNSDDIPAYCQLEDT